jgi:protein required for attachment to host cells
VQNHAIPRDTLILVGDGQRVLFLRNRGTAFELELAVEHVLEQDNPPTREQGTDKPGRYSGSLGSTPQSAFAAPDWHQLSEDRFATDIAGALYRLAHANRFENLIVVAPPKVLGTLRKTFHKEVTDRIREEIPKELTSHPLPEIQRALQPS